MVLERFGPVRRKRPVVVHFGNVGLAFPGEAPAARTLNFASRFEGINFFGIDLRPWRAEKPNWVQIQSDLLGGVRRLQNNSVSLISSEMTLGYYGRRKIRRSAVASESTSKRYAVDVLRESLRKLKRGGKMLVTVDSTRAPLIIFAALEAGFKREGILQKRVQSKNAMSYWVNEFTEYGHSSDKTNMVQITLKKSD